VLIITFNLHKQNSKQEKCENHSEHKGLLHHVILLLFFFFLLLLFYLMIIIIIIKIALLRIMAYDIQVIKIWIPIHFTAIKISMLFKI